MSEQYNIAYNLIVDHLSSNRSGLELSHAKNTLYWINIIAPNCSEQLQLAALAHDLERSIGAPVRKQDFATYEDYKLAHARRSGELTSELLSNVGFKQIECRHVAYLIEAAEFSNSDPEVQLLCDADSISFFDNNIETYLKKNGHKATKNKAAFMYDRSSLLAKSHIDKILDKKRSLNLNQDG